MTNIKKRLGYSGRELGMDVFERLAQPKARGKLLNSSISKAKPDPAAKLRHLRKLREQEEEFRKYEEERRVAAEAKR